MQQQQTAFENIVGKGEIACNEQFLLFPQCFLLNQIIVSAFVHIFDIISSFAAELEKPKIGISGKRLKLHYVRHSLVINNTVNTYNLFEYTILSFGTINQIKYKKKSVLEYIIRTKDSISDMKQTSIRSLLD